MTLTSLLEKLDTTTTIDIVYKNRHLTEVPFKLTRKIYLLENIFTKSFNVSLLQITEFEYEKVLLIIVD